MAKDKNCTIPKEQQIRDTSEGISSSRKGLEQAGIVESVPARGRGLEQDPHSLSPCTTEGRRQSWDKGRGGGRCFQGLISLLIILLWVC